MKNKGLIFLIILLIVIIAISSYAHYQKNNKSKKISKEISNDGSEKILTYRLPTSKDSDVFGPPTWGALHNLVSEIPCSLCREDGKSLMVFMHDMVNFKTKHKSDFSEIYDKENFEKWIQKTCDIKKEYDKK